ncbi:HET-domain-containing protein, partial [Mollisia scopiformis]
MRLLQCTRDSGFRLTPDMDEDEIAVHPYAILSHTWGAEGEEVTFEDLASGAGERKPGYKKIEFCGKQAEQDGLQYFWIDACCINKGNKAEFSQAIQSMFRWYRNAARCYVYLSDVSCSPHRSEEEANLLLWDLEFRQSKWFLRGWTLQELLAPSLVEFFSCQGKKLGDKISLKQQIHEITSIPLLALEGTPLSQFSIHERLRWKGDRETTRDEDGWYSLSGIFYVEIAPAYSEGAASAFRRLKEEIDKQERCVQDVRHTDPRDDKKRIEDTKGGLLADSYRWVLDNTTFQQWQQDPHNQLLWIKGDPGKGKTMLLCGIIDELHSSMPRTALLSYFFCQETDSRINSATAVLRGLLYMLVNQQPSLVSHVRKKYDHAGKTLFEDANAWVALTEIFVDVLRDPSLNTTYLIIDALDECITNRPKLLEFIAMQSSTSQRVKWIVSSRNWPDIETQLERAGHKVRLSLELNAKSVAAAVDTFIQRKVDQLAKEKRYKAEMRHAVLQHLTSNANDTFLWVALVCQDLRKTTKWNVLKKLPLFPPGLDSLYKRMMHQIGESDSAEVCRQVLASAAILYRPATIPELIVLVEQLEDFVDDLESVREIISLCGSFLTLREDTVYFVHQSAKDFLFAKALDEVFPHGTKAAHQVIFSRSLAILSKTLHRDMYSLKALGFPVKDVKRPDLDPLAASRYPCIYWIDHLHDSKPRSSANNVQYLQVTGIVNEFIKKKYLYWLEGLSLCESVEKGIVSMTKLWSIVQEMRDQDGFTQLVQDARRFVMYHKGAIESYPLQTYASALLFSPIGSLIRQLFQHEEPKGITMKLAMSDNWGACLQTLEGHSDGVHSVAFSHNSAQLASASWDKTIKIWDASSGACLQTLEGHSDG